MELKQTDIDALNKMADFESTMTPEQKSVGWSWRDVYTYTGVINRLMVLGLVKCTYSSNRYTNYMLTEKGWAVVKGEVKQESVVAPEPEELDLTGLFDEIVGYDDVKLLLKEVIQLKEPIHVLLYGPPSIAKSAFLIDIESATGSLSLPLLGSATSHAGMWDLIVERHPKFILIDEVEKMGLQDMAGLLSLMEHQRIIRAKVGRKIEEHVDCRVFAAANRIGKLPPELLSRFWKKQLTEYNATEYVKVVESILCKRENIEPNDAHRIAMGLVGRTHDVRDAIRVARISKRVGVEKALELWSG
jgi:Holliday junction DNA helicase RuvB